MFKGKAIFWNVTDLLLIALCVVYCISGSTSGLDVSSVALEEAFRYAVLYFLAKIVFAAGGRVASVAVFLAFSLWSARESVLGLSQVFGHVPSGHAVFGMTGSFSNPGPYGGFIAMSMSMAAGFLMRYRSVWRYAGHALLYLRFPFGPGRTRCREILRWILTRLFPASVAAISLVLGILVLPASMSRAGWLSFAVAAAVCLGRETKVMQSLRRRKGLAVSVAVAAVILCAGAFLMKKDSASGRLHIWNMEVRAIAASPWTGTGPGTSLGAYGKAQEEYFREKGRPESVIKVAGCPEYAFNEYLKTGMEAGLPGMALCIAAVLSATVTLVVRRSPFAYGLLSVAVFAFFSYPLSVTLLAVSATVLLAAGSLKEERRYRTGRGAGIFSALTAAAVALALVYGSVSLWDSGKSRRDATKAWEASRYWSGTGLYDEAVSALEPLYPEMRWNYRYLYDYGYALYKEGRYGESIAVLKEGAAISSDPMFHNIIGRALQATGDVTGAEREYQTAHYMVPCRLYPLVLLMDMYIESGRVAEAEETGKRILSMPVNQKNRTMLGLQDEVRQEMDSLSETSKQLFNGKGGRE